MRDINANYVCTEQSSTFVLCAGMTCGGETAELWMKISLSLITVFVKLGQIQNWNARWSLWSASC